MQARLGSAAPFYLLAGAAVEPTPSLPCGLLVSPVCCRLCGCSFWQCFVPDRRHWHHLSQGTAHHAAPPHFRLSLTPDAAACATPSSSAQSLARPGLPTTNLSPLSTFCFGQHCALPQSVPRGSFAFFLLPFAHLRLLHSLPLPPCRISLVLPGVGLALASSTRRRSVSDTQPPVVPGNSPPI